MIALAAAVPDWVRRHPALVLTLLCALLLGTGLDTLPLLDRDEPRFASATREMLERGDLVVPTFNGAWRFDKPILTYWLMAVPYALFGWGEATARLHAVLATWALVLLVHRWGRDWFGPAAGLAAGFATLLCLQLQIHGRLALADPPLVFAIALAHFGIARLLGLGETDRQKKARDFGHQDWTWFWVTYLALGFGFLAKGPLALLVPGLTIVLHRWVFWRQDIQWSRLQLVYGLGVVIAVVAPWGIFALAQTHGRFFEVGVGQHVVRRGLDAWGGRMFIGPFFYAGTAIVSLLPWLAFLASVISWSRRNWTARTAFLLAWFTGPYLIFSVYATQLMHYPMPGYPGFFLLLGATCAAAFSGGHGWARGRTWFATFFGLYALITAAVAAAAFLPLPSPRFDGVGQAVAGAAALIGGLTLAGFALRFPRHGWAFAASVALLAVGQFTFARGLRDIHPTIQLAERIRSAPPEKRLIAHRFQEGSLVFYSGRRDWQFIADWGELEAELVRRGPLLAILQEEELDLGRVILQSAAALVGRDLPVETGSWDDEIRAALRPDDRISTVEGFNPGRARWVRLVVIERG